MKKFAMLALAMSLFLVACGEKKEEEKPAEQPAAEATAPATEAPATEAAAEGKATELKNAETASGERYADDAGNEVAMKGTEGILTLGDLKEVPVTVEAK
ncbi:MliC family protein [Fusobacterium polymorphum]|uniref:MliC family protein n=1 Tax=Fusobacterium nucleatum subsp. polymorphum TaxID=76857 RepID=UPI00300BE5FD